MNYAFREVQILERPSERFKTAIWWAKPLFSPVFYHSFVFLNVCKNWTQMLDRRTQGPSWAICDISHHGPYATPPIMGHMRPHHDCIPWFYFHPLQHLFSDLMWNLNTFYLIFPVAVPFLTGFLCMTFMYRWKEFWSDDSNYPSVHKELRQGCRKLLKREEKLLPRFLGFPLIGRMSPHLWWRIS